MQAVADFYKQSLCCTHQGELCLRQLVSSPSLSDLVKRIEIASL